MMQKLFKKRCAYTYVVLFFVMLFLPVQAKKDYWTSLFKKKFTQQELQENSKKKVVVLQKKDVSPFSQLLFSWNAFRPKNNHFTFFVSVRDAKTKRWGEWHKMIDWGDGVQRSYFSSKGTTKYIYVRLETGTVNLADGFALKIKTKDGKQLEKLKGISVCTSNFNQFNVEKRDFSTLPSVVVKGVPRYSQMVLPHERAGHMCSPTSCSMLSGYLSRSSVDPLWFAEHSFDNGLNVYGSWPFNTACAFEVCKGTMFFSVARLPSFQQLHSFLKRKIPVVVSVRGVLPGAPKTYDKGHLLLVIGWDAKKNMVLCHDPAMDKRRKVVKQYQIDDFLSAWERSHRLAYIVEPFI